MRTRIQGLRTLAPLSFRRFAGAIADVWSVRGEVGCGGFYIAPDPRIVVFLGEAPPPVALRAGTDKAERRGIQASMSPKACRFGPGSKAGMKRPIWISTLKAAACGSGSPPRTCTRTCPGRAWLGPGEGLARLAADEVRAPRRGDMLIDALLSATLAEIFATQPQPAAPAGALSARRFAAVESHLRENLNRHVPLAELAGVADLSESRFSYAFKRLRNETPRRWQARLRLDAARAMLGDPARSLADIAYATGFSDQANLSRAFRAAHGMPPSLWRRRASREP